jgi:hypothetical protein
MMTNLPKKHRERAARLKRALLAEKRKFGGIDDGYGKRYLIGPLYVLAGALDEALAFYKWYARNCPDDSGDPLHYLFWSLALYRTGAVDRAADKLLETVIQNVYLLPALVGLAAPTQELWHSSNLEMPAYADSIPPELRPELSAEECSWIKEQLESFRFRRVVDEYVATYRALKDEREVGKRTRIVNGWYAFVSREVAGKASS